MKGQKKKNSTLSNHLYNGQTILVSGMDGMFCPNQLIDQILKTDIHDLTLIYMGDEYYGPDSGVLKLIQDERVTKLVTSNLGQMSENWDRWVDEVVMLPPDILMHKISAAANGLPGVYVCKEYAEMYSCKKWIDRHSLKMPVTDGGGEVEVVLEPAIEADIGLLCVNSLDLTTFDSSFHDQSYNCVEVAKACNLAFVQCDEECERLQVAYPQINGQYVNGYVIKNPIDHAGKFHCETPIPEDHILKRACKEVPVGSENGEPIVVFANSRLRNAIEPILKEMSSNEKVSLHSFMSHDVNLQGYLSFVNSRKIQINIIQAAQVSVNGDVAAYPLNNRFCAMTEMRGSRMTIACIADLHSAESSLVDEMTLPIAGHSCIDLVITKDGVYKPTGTSFKVLEKWD